MTQTTKISKNNTTVLREGDKVTVILHQTPVVTVDYAANTVCYDTVGWTTATTVTRMNQASNELGLPYRVSRAGGEMVARDYIGGIFHFTDNKCVLPLKPKA